MKIFLVAGKSGSGKNEVAKLIKEYYIYKLEECAITSYAKFIKSFALELTDWDGTGTKPRDFMQRNGDIIRSLYPDYFTGRMIQDIPIYEKYVKALVVSDVRMPEEIEKIKEVYDDVYAIYVENQFAQSKLTVEQQAHVTETALEDYDDFDYVIANDSLDNLRTTVFKYLEGLNGK